MDNVISSGGYAASQRYARELDERFSISFKEEIQGNGLPVAAIVSIENGCLIKRQFPKIYSPLPFIKKEETEIQRYSLAVQKKEAELITLRKNEDYVGITTAAKYKNEYQSYVDRATMRLEDLKKRAPERIQQSIEQGKQYIKLLKEETAKAEQSIADAEKLKKQYEA